jgi:hypothetical protein
MHTTTFTTPTALLACTLAGTLALTSLVHARPRQRPQPVPSSLSATERLCEAYGQFALARGHDRDGGMPLMRMLALSRAYDVRNGASAWTRETHDSIIQAVYANFAMGPRQAQQLTEVACLEGLSSREQATSARDRY